MSVLVIVFLTGVLTLFSKGKWANNIAILGTLGALIVSFFSEISFVDSYQKMFWFDEHATLLTKITLVVNVLILFLGDFALYRHKNHRSEMYALVLFSLCGGFLLFGFQNIMVLFLGIEILSIPLYVLAGSEKTNLRSVEASVKYFLMGAFATGFLLFGFALLYGSVGSFDLETISQFSQKQGGNTKFILGAIFVLGAMAFKVAMVPFHMWSPDVYYGSPTWVTLFMASVVKIAGFYTFLKLMNIAFIGIREDWLLILYGMISLTLLVGSFLGLVQDDVKKMLAYSSIVNVGYIGLVFFGVDENSAQNLAFYLLAYSLANIGVFMGVIWVEKYKESTFYHSFNGLAKSQKLLVLTISISLLSMAGIPFTAGFMGKLGMFLPAVKESLFLVILAVLASVVSVAYYLRLIMAMYFRKEENEQFTPKLNFSYKLIAILVIVLTFILGVLGSKILYYLK